ncbi:hypothetical protein ACSQ7D_00165 [Capnocytophaga sp. G1920]|uniref:hypothetical protein n=1 Tax=Capnocytophaga sp. G1920 TaxID=3448875 RepID=UPI003EDB91D7
MKEKAEQYFEENKEVKYLFATSDGFLFLQKKDAQNHAETLEDKQVDTFTREEKEMVGLENLENVEASETSESSELSDNLEAEVPTEATEEPAEVAKNKPFKPKK